MNIQKIAENACEEAYFAYEPKEGISAIVMDPYTGAVLAMASIPDYDLNNPRGCPASINPFLWQSLSEEEKMKQLMSGIWRNRAISDTYEDHIRSTTAIALRKLTCEDETFLTHHKYPNCTISCWREHERRNHRNETCVRPLSAPATCMSVGEPCRYETYYQYVQGFGFYDKTGSICPPKKKRIFTGTEHS